MATASREGQTMQSSESTSSAATSATTPDEIVQDEITGTHLRKIVSLQDQSSRMPAKKLLVVTLSLIFAIFLSSFEQVSVSTTLPGIARDFGASAAISWVGTAFLVAKFVPFVSGLFSVSSQVIYSRLSDIFGRKILLMIAISIFTLGNLLCGFAKNFEQLIAFRVVAGLGGGGINVLVLIIMSDIVSLKERGKVSSSIVLSDYSSKHSSVSELRWEAL
jgi:predicted MFS family arabinose efflux permease